MKKKFFSALCIGMLSLSMLTGCNNGNNENASSETGTTTEIADRKESEVTAEVLEVVDGEIGGGGYKISEEVEIAETSTSAPEETETSAPTPTEPDYTQSIDEVQDNSKSDWDNQAKEILAKLINANMTELQKVKAIHDYMVVNYDYDYFNYKRDMVSDSSYTPQGAFENG